MVSSCVDVENLVPCVAALAADEAVVGRPGVQSHGASGVAAIDPAAQEIGRSAGHGIDPVAMRVEKAGGKFIKPRLSRRASLKP